MSALRVVEPGLAATLQDFGRPGYGRYGVPESGAMDRLALRLANLLVGNRDDEAAIEFVLVGGVFEALDGGCRVAVAGGAVEMSLDGVAVPAYRGIDVPAGGRLRIGAMTSGVYGVLAVAGGFDVLPVLGSRSVHARSGLGGGPLQAGSVLPLREGPPAGPVLALDPASWPDAAGPIRVIWGPQDDCFTPKGKADFLAGEYRVAPRSDRMGYRLDGPPIEHAGDFNIVSDGITLGAIQVPGTRQPIVLLADRQPTGGYPKIATIVSGDIRRLVQRGPGAPVRFAVVPPDEADALLKAERRAFAALRGHIRPVVSGDLWDSERLLGLNLVDGVVSGMA